MTQAIVLTSSRGLWSAQCAEMTCNTAFTVLARQSSYRCMFSQKKKACGRVNVHFVFPPLNFLAETSHFKSCSWADAALKMGTGLEPSELRYKLMQIVIYNENSTIRFGTAKARVHPDRIEQRAWRAPPPCFGSLYSASPRAAASVVTAVQALPRKHRLRICKSLDQALCSVNCRGSGSHWGVGHTA